MSVPEVFGLLFSGDFGL